VSVRDERGVDRPARIVALVENSIFQSELLVSGDTFRRLYPGRAGYGRLLVRASDEDAAALAAEFRRALSDFGVTVETTAERMASFAEVANSYISAFQALGALGLLLGSLGLVVVLARGVVERRAEIALMGSIGFGGARIATLFAVENVFLLAAGVFAGAASAAVAVAPELARSGATSRAGLTLAVFSGIVVTVAALLSLASARLVRDVTPAALRRE
jgi:putative ABC transport system permease protein